MSSSLRRRVAGDSSQDAPSAVSDDQTRASAKDFSSPAPKPTVQKKSFGSKRWNLFVLGLGGVLGIVLAGWFAQNNEMIDLAAITDLNLETIADIVPAGLLQDAKDLQKHEREAVNYDSFAVGLHARSQGVQASNPVIMVPGVISTGLESWGTEEISRQYFRKRLWGSWTMMKALVMDKPNWKQHIMLDKHTGLDPPGGIKLRAAQGFDATDFFITGYWIWNKILENLATIGYDPTNAFTAAYDWRLSYMNYEKRDQYFTRLKSHIELAVKVSDKKVVLLSHSMGSQVLYYFFHWVEARGYGDGGPNWVEEHVDSWINISGCMLGTPKGMPAVLSGEMKDTAQLNAFAVYGAEKFLSRSERAEIFRAMPGISSMLPIGGEAVWGNHESAPDDAPGQNNTFGSFIRFREINGTTDGHNNMTVTEALPFLFKHSEEWYEDMITSSYSHGVAHTKEEIDRNQDIPSKWINPLETRLPLAPSLKIYCFYGIGKPTERAYFYRPDHDLLSSLNVTMDTGYTAGEVDHGILMGEGDGTVNLLSTGYMCAKGWKMKRYNPAGAQIKTYEMPHEPDRFSPRGGPNTGDHVDILGRSSLNDMILKVAGGKGHTIDNHIVSNILEYADKVAIRDDDDDSDYE
ncbi:phospholipid:diacylglycerol acyltransferase-like protein [Phyllosticta citriasiana]|uniref:Phospholipid:diacylglycerol acyltransferase-like protein n=2 Tax=Phyllosticta citriasiana TaxID=595635 RepID=A0ABR1KEX5_9PEZI